MKRCETEGDLRAYLDRALPGPDRDRVAAHLAECGECDLRFREVSARAERVATALSALADGIAPARVRPAAAKVRVWSRDHDVRVYFDKDTDAVAPGDAVRLVSALRRDG